MKVEMEHNKFLNQRRVFKKTDYDDYLIAYSQDGLMYKYCYHNRNGAVYIATIIGTMQYTTLT